MVVVARILVFVLGAGLVMGTLGSAVRTVVLPRAVPTKLASAVFVTVRRLFGLRLGRNATYERRDHVMAPYGQTSLLILALVWLTVTLGGYMAMFWAVGTGSPRESFITSGSSLLISVTREEYDAAYDRLAAAGIALVADRDDAWRSFAGWRVNYDQVLITLCALVMAPYAPWSSDRSVARFRVKVLRSRDGSPKPGGRLLRRSAGERSGGLRRGKE